MKVSGKEIKITLKVLGRERTFSEEELTSILEEHFSNVPFERVSSEINFSKINQSLFEERREDARQERARRLIVEAFEEVKKNPKKYKKKFKTIIPKKNWNNSKVIELKNMAKKIGDHMADWVEQALEWAQRISDGETWESICNELDHISAYRAIIWKNGKVAQVGMSPFLHEKNTQTSIYESYFYDHETLYNIVPLIVIYEY